MGLCVFVLCVCVCVCVVCVLCFFCFRLSLPLCRAVSVFELSRSSGLGLCLRSIGCRSFVLESWVLGFGCVSMKTALSLSFCDFRIVDFYPCLFVVRFAPMTSE